MPVIASPIARFPGEITLPAALTFPQFAAWRDSVMAAQERLEKSPGDFGASDAALLPGILAVVAEWRIDKLPQPLTADNFPATPRRASNALVAWLVRCISALVNEEEETPKD